MSNEEQVAYLFFSGAEMDPTTVWLTYPGARFVARAWLKADGVPLAPAFAGSLDGEIWGILVSVPGHVGTASGTREAVTDDGRRYPAAVATAELTAGEPPAVLAAARYWELPPAYVAQLGAAIAALGSRAAEEDPSDGD